MMVAQNFQGCCVGLIIFQVLKDSECERPILDEDKSLYSFIEKRNAQTTIPAPASTVFASFAGSRYQMLHDMSSFWKGVDRNGNECKKYRFRFRKSTA